MTAVALSEHEEQLFEAAQHGNLNVFSEYYFRLPFSGTRYTPQDRVNEYEALHVAWTKLGNPGNEITLFVHDKEITYLLEWGDYGSEPCFLYRHGYVFLPWALEMLKSRKRIAVVEGGTGSSKTSSIGISWIMQCALYPGVDILNVAPTTTQATDMLSEIAKWVVGSHFEKFVVPTASGDLFKLKPFPTITIDVFGIPSTFMCMTVGQRADFVLGKDKDAVRVDEASLIQNIGDAIPRLISRIRGVRADGRPRGVKPYIAFITNPHDGNYSFEILKEKAKAQHDDPTSMYFFAKPRSTDNVYITQQQLEVQMELMDDDEQSRWLDGSDEVFRILGTIPINIIEECHSPALDEMLEFEKAKGEAGSYMWREGMGIVRYMLPAIEGRRYLVFGDPGQVNATSLRLNNVPVTGAWDITDFPHKRAELVSLNLLDGNGKYGPWIEEHEEYLMLTYQAIGAYDATGMGKAFAEWPDMEDYPIYPVTLSGNNKGTAKTMFLLMAGRGMFGWPRLQVLWHQAKAYRETGPGVNKLPDDVIAGMFVSAFYLRYDFWNALSQMFGWNKRREQRESQDGNPNARATSSRYRRRGGRYARKGSTKPKLEVTGVVSQLD